MSIGKSSRVVIEIDSRYDQPQTGYDTGFPAKKLPGS